jgi:hypothetical protein
MPGGLKVFVGVLAGGGIATANMPAGNTFAELHPAQSFLNAGLANLAAGLHCRIGLLHVLALRHKNLLIENIAIG